MGHHAENVSAAAADAGDVIEGAVGIGCGCDRASCGRVTENYAVFAVQLVEGRLIAKIISLHVADGNGQHFSLRAGLGEWGGRIFDANMNRLANIFEAAVAKERSGQEAGFAKNLEAVADSEHEAAAVGKAADRFHDGREFCDGAGAQVIAEGKASGDDDGVAIFKIVRFVPEKSNRLFGYLLDGPERVAIAVGAGEDDYAEFHGMGFSRFQFSMGEIEQEGPNRTIAAARRHLRAWRSRARCQRCRSAPVEVMVD